MPLVRFFLGTFPSSVWQLPCIVCPKKSQKMSLPASGPQGPKSLHESQEQSENTPSSLSQGQISAQGILHLRNPNLGPNRVGFLILFFSAKEAPRKIHPQEIHLPKFTFQNSTQKSGDMVHMKKRQVCDCNMLHMTIDKWATHEKRQV